MEILGVAPHGVGARRHPVVVWAWIGAGSAGVVVMDVATVSVAIIPVFEALDLV